MRTDRKFCSSSLLMAPTDVFIDHYKAFAQTFKADQIKAKKKCKKGINSNTFAREILRY